MVSCVLFSRPHFDSQTAYLYSHSKELVALSIAQGHKTINKEGESTTGKIISEVIKKLKPKFIFFNGHGSPELICGHKNDILISIKNVDILNGSITYSLSCSSALGLGDLSVSKGAKTFIGYSMDFALGRDTESEAVPGKDKIAKLFLEPSNILVASILKGNNVSEAISKSKKKMEENISYLATTGDFPDAEHYAPFLYGNYLGLSVHGDVNASI